MTGRLASDAVARTVFRWMAVGSCLLALPIVFGLLFKSLPVLRANSLLSLLLSSEWKPLAGSYGMRAFLAGTVAVTCLAMVLAIPVSLLSAIYLSEYAPTWFRRLVLPLIDLLSGIPSVIYGVVGVLVVVPAVFRLSKALGGYSSGYCLLSGALVLAVMVSPFIIHVCREIFGGIPEGMREASLSLGATKWETVKHVVLRKSRAGIVAAVMLGLTRALGETIAVLMVVGNVPVVPKSLFDPAYPLPALLANNYGEMMSIPLYDSALMFSALVLLVTVLVFHVAARALLRMTAVGGG